MEKKVRFMNSKLDEFLESFNKSILFVTKGSYGGKWPMPHFTSVDVGMAIDNYWCDFFLDIIKKLKVRELNTKEIANKIAHPSTFSRAFYANLQLKVKNYPPEKITEMNEFVAELLYYCYKNDIFCTNWTNILWDKEQIKTNFRPEKIIRVKDIADKKPIICYNGYLRAITEMLFFYWDNFGHEIHGPYKLDSGEILLIREWHDLRPEYFEFSKNFPYDHIRIYEIYSPETKIKIDISNRCYINLRTDECLLGFYFECASRALDLAETVSAFENIKNTCAQGVAELTSLRSEQILEKAAHMHFYLFKPLTDMLGISWKPSEDCMIRIGKGVTNNDKKVFEALIKTPLDEISINQLFDCRLKLPPAFYG